ncbi:MAG TPA: hypothetical protein VGR07_23895 [Thermoanaerobaculia bacterium]|nr:hypothetical protein [Thermoanaerobaculia bacterium]
MSTMRTTRRLCCHLRWRELEPETAPDSPHPCSADGFFLCTHTLSHIGPDDRVADEASCRPGRVCFEDVCPPEPVEDRPVAGNAAG